MRIFAFSLAEAAYLKHIGREMDDKVTVAIIDGVPCFHIRDFRFYTFEKARAFLQHIAETECVGVNAEVRS